MSVVERRRKWRTCSPYGWNTIFSIAFPSSLMLIDMEKQYGEGIRGQDESTKTFHKRMVYLSMLPDTRYMASNTREDAASSYSEHDEYERYVAVGRK